MSTTATPKPAKASHDFGTLDTYVRAIFRELAESSPETHDLKLTASGARAVSDLTLGLLERVVDRAQDVVHFGGEKALMVRHLEGALALLMEERLAEEAGRAGHRAWDAFKAGARAGDA